jgi:2-haloacid dehalogenase
MAEVEAVVFDAYGTLLDVNAAMARHAKRIGPNWEAVSADWRLKQLEYSWVRSLAGRHRDFWRLTEEALAFAAAHHGITDAALLADVLKAYRCLDAYPDVVPALEALRGAGLKRAILSNGEPAMLKEAARHAGIEPLLDAVLSVESVGVFKPDPRVYRLACDRLGVPSARIAFVSSNPWDAFGAASFGFRVFWLNRTGKLPEYDLHGLATEIATLASLPDRIS